MRPKPVDTSTWDIAGDPLVVARCLSEIAAPTGNEDRMTAAVGDYVRRRGWKSRTDRLGQITVSAGNPDADTSLMLVAHMDELGLVVRAIEPDGWLRVHRLGGMPERVLPGLRMVVHTRAGDLPANVGIKSHHLTEPEEKYVAAPAPKLYLDAGFGSDTEAARAGVRVGDPVTYAAGWTDFGTGRFAGKSLDNRVGVLSMLRVLHDLERDAPTARVDVVFSCLEEFNLQGPVTAARELQPDIALVVDIVPATDTPDLVGMGTTRLGSGPSISRFAFHGRGTLGGLVPHPALVEGLEQAAERSAVAIQYDAVIGCLNDSAYLPVATPRGIAVASLNIPCRYTHSPVEMADLSDVIRASTLIADLARHARELPLDRPYLPQLVR